jgi:hypothetical protein
MMKTLFFFVLIFCMMTVAGQVGVHTDFPDNSSAMDIVAANRGLLIPRVTLTSSLSNPSPVTAPAIGLLVFNSGPNQAIGFYYWSGSAWTLIGGSGGSGGNDWTLTGNAGTIPGTNFLGTTDNNHFLVKTNNAERMRFESDGQVIVGGTAPQAASHVFTVFGNSTQNFAIATYSPTVGYYNFGGRYGVFSQVDTACNPNPGYAVWAKNTDVSSYGIYAVGSNVSSLPLITNHTAGITSYGFDGLHAWGRNTITGYGICAIGSGQNSSYVLDTVSAGVSSTGLYGIIARGTKISGRGIVAIGSGMSSPFKSQQSEGGAFTGHHGIYARGFGSTSPVVGIGVIGIGYPYEAYSALPDNKSLGGSFSGDYGLYGKGMNVTDGVGVLGVGSGGSGYHTVTNGSGGAFTGYHGLLAVGSSFIDGIGILAAGNDTSYILPSMGAGGSLTGLTLGVGGFGKSSSNGVGVFGAGNNQIANIILPSSGSGGAFQGSTIGAVGYGLTVATGTGIVGGGNNITNPNTYPNGSGGAFTGNAAGVVGWGKTVATGIGVIGVGNNTTTSLPATGSGGAFTGTVCGVYGYATNTTNSNRYGGYFETAGAYAYVGVRYNNTNRKILGTNSVSTIIKNTKGDLVILTCPEAPETVFQDFGIGQLVNGHAHIEIDPDLAININVDESHPLKVYITPEGDCNGIYVTNKSANGFDVIELMGGASNVTFSWQIVATRADESYTLKDGRVEVAINSERFPPAPGPLEITEQPAVQNQMNILETIPLETIQSGKESYRETMDYKSGKLEVIEDDIIEVKDDIDE